MKLLDLTLDTPAENLALDEALLEQAECNAQPTEVLRLWEPLQSMVVVGRSSRVESEVHRQQCRQRGIPILRRSSGGAAIVTGPGCLMYGVVLNYQRRPALRMIAEAHRFVLQVLARAVGEFVAGVKYRGCSDLALGDKKFSGNSLRCKRTHLLYHGTLLYDFPLELIDHCLAMPPRQPDYRQGRGHGRFVANLPIAPADLRRGLAIAWNARERVADWPRQLTAQLVRQKYSQEEWNDRL